MGQKFPFGAPENLNALALPDCGKIFISGKNFLPLSAFNM
jgi:hypothetical protein